MSCQRSPPPSPRAPKIQQESWDCGTPPIDLFDPCQDSPPRSPNRSQQPPKSPKSPRKFNKPINVGYYEPRSPSMSSRSLNYSDQRSPKYENPPRSPKITTTYANDDDTSSSSFYQTPTGSRGSPKTSFYYDSHQSPRRSPMSPRKFVFDAISPSYEQKGKKFEYYEPVTPDDEDDEETHRMGYKDSHHHIPKHTKSQQQCSSSSPPSQQQGHHSSQSSPSPSTLSSQKRRRSRSFKSRPFDLKSPSDDEAPSGLSGNGGRANGGASGGSSGGGGGGGGGSGGGGGGAGGCDGNKEFSGMEINEMMVTSSGNHKFQHHLTELTALSGGRSNLFAKRDSCMTESTQLSGDSCETNTTTMTTTTTLITSSAEDGSSECPISDDYGGHPTNTNIMNGDIGNCNGNNGSSSVAIRRPARARRHAINITSNPGYQVLHSSHSTLDRTCSDSVVSLRCRKSTSDLTDVTETTAPILSKPRRRGSSKGGLAYLASRRSSRESIKSACSNTSIFSNEDIGPLAFQASSRGRQRRTSNFLELPVPDHIRPRVCSLPDRPYNPRVSDDLYRLRHFSISKGTVVNCGDSIISRRSRSNTSVNSTTSRASERSPFDGSCCGGGYANVDSMPPSPTDSEPPPPPRYRVVMLGDAGVGKTALVSQFMTSEYMHTYDASLDDEFGEKTVSVLLDDEESELVFIDHPSVEMSVENSLSTYEPHACVVAYSVVDRNSFRVAEEIVNYLWRENLTKDKAVILVGNKADLARSRVITTTEGKALAATRDAKFIETSSGIQHNVDELLVGVLKQMRLKEKRDKKAAMGASKMKPSKTHISLHLAKEILQKICLSDITKSKSCENLHVL